MLLKMSAEIMYRVKSQFFGNIRYRKLLLQQELLCFLDFKLVDISPLDVKQRNVGLKYAQPIHVGNNVWIIGGVKILSGVTIGDNTVVATGSVVTEDVPTNVLARGAPCRVISQI